MQLNAFVVVTNTKFSHKSPIKSYEPNVFLLKKKKKSYEENPCQTLKYPKKDLKDTLVFLFSLPEDDKHHITNKK